MEEAGHTGDASGAVRALATLGATAVLLAAAPHNKHFSHARVVQDGTAIVARVRMFKDDLEKVLRRKLADDAASKAAVSEYVVRQLGVSADNVPLRGEVVDHGSDAEGDQSVWWVLVQWTAKSPPKKIAFRDHLLFDLFDDQQNLLILSRMPGDERRTLYFQAGDKSEQAVSW